MSYMLLIVAEGPLVATDCAQPMEEFCGNGTESGPGQPHRQRFFNPREQKWHSLPNCSRIDPRCWEVEGDLVAFKQYQEQGTRRRTF